MSTRAKTAKIAVPTVRSCVSALHLPPGGVFVEHAQDNFLRLIRFMLIGTSGK